MGTIHIISDANIVVSGLLHSIKKTSNILHIRIWGHFLLEVSSILIMQYSKMVCNQNDA